MKFGRNKKYSIETKTKTDTFVDGYLFLNFGVLFMYSISDRAHEMVLFALKTQIQNNNDFRMENYIKCLFFIFIQRLIASQSIFIDLSIVYLFIIINGKRHSN